MRMMVIQIYKKNFFNIKLRFSELFIKFWLNDNNDVENNVFLILFWQLKLI